MSSFFTTKRFRIIVVSIFLLYGLFTILTTDESHTINPHSLFSLRYKFNKSSDSINLKTFGQPLNLDNKKLAENSSLREQLAFQFPYEPHKPFPKYIWQTWKVDIEDSKFPNSFKYLVNNWKISNPEYIYKLLPDSACHELIKTLYQSIPDVLTAYEALPHSILKADFFRYLILFAKGGVYSDIDTFNLKSIDQWPSVSKEFEIYNNHKDFTPNDLGILIGIEADPDRPDWKEWYARRIQFCQWTIQAKKGHPLLLNLINKITEITLERIEDKSIKLQKGKDQGTDIMNWTGPGIFTDEIFNYLNNISENNKKSIINDNTNQEIKPENGLQDLTLDEIENKKIVNWKLFTGMTDMILIDDVLILPITSFSPGVGQMGSEDETHHLAFVKHMFQGSWKNDKKN